MFMVYVSFREGIYSPFFPKGSFMQKFSNGSKFEKRTSPTGACFPYVTGQPYILYMIH